MDKLYNITFADATIDDIFKGLKSIISDEKISKYIKDHKLIEDFNTIMDKFLEVESRFVEFIFQDGKHISIDPSDIASFYETYKVNTNIVLKNGKVFTVLKSYEQVKEMLS